jgi:hypothetical protein
VPTPPERTATTLYRAAQRNAQKAAGDLAAGNHDDSIAQAGIALEHLMKAYLVSQSPLLIVGQTGAGLDLAGMRWALRRVARPSAESKTITATEAARRCCSLLPDLDEKSLRVVLAARNGVLHIGQTDSEAGRVMAEVAAAAEIILPEIGKDARSLWGNYRDAVMGRLDDQRSETAHRVADRIAQSREGWHALRARHGLEGLNALREKAEGHHYDVDEVRVDCPACGSPARLSGEIEVDEIPNYDWDGGEWSLLSVELAPFLLPTAFTCLACGLRLDGADELVAAQFSTERKALDSEALEWEHYFEKRGRRG